MAPPDKKKGKQEILRHGGAIRILSLELLGFKNLLSPGNSQELGRKDADSLRNEVRPDSHYILLLFRYTSFLNEKMAQPW